MATSSTSAGSRSRRWTRASQIVLNAALLIAAAWIFAVEHRGGPLLLVVVLGIFVPFSLGRLVLHDLLSRHLAPRILAASALVGIVLDLTMGAQLLCAPYADAPGILAAPGITWFGPVWFSAHALWLTGFVAVNVLRVGTRPLRRRLPSRTIPNGLDRREFLQRAGLAGAALPFGASLSSVPISYDFRLERRAVFLPNWPAALDGLKVVHLSDIHVGGQMNRKRLARVVELTNEQEPALVLHTGDFLTHRLGSYDEPLYEALGRIKAAHGQWACFGNHDFEHPAHLAARLADSGVTVLRDRMAAVDIDGHPLEIGGLDFVFDRPRRATVYRQVIDRWPGRSKSPRLLLSHDPTGFAHLPAGCADLVLSGHTHGGHIGIQLTPSHAITLVGLFGIPDQGLFGDERMQLHVTRCVGFYGFPMRIGIPPEVALLTLRALPQNV